MRYFLMEGATDGAGSGGGSGGGGATGAGGAGSGSSGTGASSSGTTEGTGGSGAGTSGTGSPPWHGLTEPDAVAYVGNKGWQNPADVIKSYQGAEKLIGRDPNTLLVMPRADDPAGFRAVMTKLGLPETPDKYELAVPKDNAHEGFVGWAKNTFHKIGLTAQQAKDLSAEHTAFVTAANEQAIKDYNLSVAADKQSLIQEWRGGHDRMMNAAKTAANALGFTGDMIDAMERAVGYAATMKHFAALGQKMGEDGFVTGDGKQKFGDTMTPDEAKAEWDRMKADPVQHKALFDESHPGHKAAKEKQTKLFGIMYPD